METLRAFLEVGFTFLAVGCPIVILGAMIAIGVSMRSSERKAERAFRRDLYLGKPPFEMMYRGAEGCAGALVEIILALFLILNIAFVTVPYGRSHGWCEAMTDPTVVPWVIVWLGFVMAICGAALTTRRNQRRPGSSATVGSAAVALGIVLILAPPLVNGSVMLARAFCAVTRE